VRTIRPRPGDLEAATRPHVPVPSGQYVGASVEVCDLCGCSFTNQSAHPSLATHPDAQEDVSDLPHRAGLLPGWTVQLLTGEEARQQLPVLFTEGDDGSYFNACQADGNDRWVDYWPDLVLIVRNPQGNVAVASDASEWHMRELDAALPTSSGP
jgi:hypothetical protein